LKCRCNTTHASPASRGTRHPCDGAASQDFLPAARAERQSFPSLPKQRIRPHTTSFAYCYTRASYLDALRQV
jgi:hypothetical protein